MSIHQASLALQIMDQRYHQSRGDLQRAHSGVQNARDLGHSTPCPSLKFDIFPEDILSDGLQHVSA